MYDPGVARNGAQLEGLIGRIGARLDRLERPVLWAMSLVGIAFLGALDYLTGTEASFALFYLFPVAIASWWLGVRAGVATSVLSAFVWYLANDLAGQQYSAAFMPVWNSSIRLAFFLVVTFLLARVHEGILRDRALARVDYLTGACNVRAFHEIAEAECLRASRYPQPFTLAYIDLDGFKAVNDRLGHAVGDKVLCAVAQTLRAGIRRPDTLARLGGDEFALLLPQTDLESAKVFLPRLRDALLAAMRRNGWRVTFSVGALTCPLPPVTLSEVVRQADGLMYEVKRAGRDAIRYGVYEGAARLTEAAGEATRAVATAEPS